MRGMPLAAALVTAGLAAIPAAAHAATTLTPIPGSPFSTVGSPVGYGEGPTGLAFSGDGSLLTTANSDGSISEFSVGSGGQLTRRAGAYIGPYQPAYAAAWNPAGTVLAVGYAPGLKQNATAVYTRVPGHARLTLHQTLYTGGDVELAFSPNGRYFAEWAGESGAPGGQASVAVYRVATDGTLTQVATETFDNLPISVAFSPNGRDLAIGDVGAAQVNVLSVGSFTPIHGSPFTVGGGANELAYSPNGRNLATANVDSSTISVASVAASGALAPRTAVSTPGSVASIAWNPSGTLLAGSSGATDSVFSVAAGQLTPIPGSPFTVGGSVGQLQFSPNGKDLDTAVVDGTHSAVAVDAVSVTP